MNKTIDPQFSQITSPSRVASHGEVFTAAREVNAMLDLVKAETERIDSRFLEPACGTGNFLVEVLKRKLQVVVNRYSKNQLEFERYAVLAVSSIYGVDILQDNVQTCRDRLLEIFANYYLRHYKSTFKPECIRTAKFILSRNILWGDALSLKTPDDKAEPIIFSEWSAVNGSLMKRRDFTLSHLLDIRPFEGGNLFSDLGDEAFIPEPVADFPLTHFLELGEEVIDSKRPEGATRC